MENVVAKAAGDEDLLFPDLDPLDDDDFVVLLERLANQLNGATERQEAKALRDALDLLDITWAGLTAAAVTRIVDAVRAVLAGSVDKILPRTSPVFEAAARAVIPKTRINLIRRERLEIDPRLTEADRNTGQALLRQQGLFIRDEYGRRADAAVERVKGIVSAAVRRGLPQDEITSLLADDLTLAQLGRARAYWDVLGTAFANRARTTTQLNAYAEAGVVTYRFVAVMDDRTTQICRFLNGRIFKVSVALARMRRAEQLNDPDKIRNVLPWVATRADERGRLAMLYEHNGQTKRVAYVDNGDFTDGLSDDELEAAGVSVPPLHVRCRSTIERES